MAKGSDILFWTEYVKDVLHFVIVRHRKTLTSTNDTHCFCTDDDFLYENYYSDFGPLNIGCVYRYCELVNSKLKQYLNKKVIIHYTSIDPKKRSNAAFLIGCFGVLYLSLSPREALKPLVSNGMTYKPFQDAIMGESMYTISLLDCFCAIKKARELQFFNFKDFDLKEFELLNRIHGGDLNWIVPEKFLAFIGPVDANNSITIFHPPEMYIDYFLENNVKIVIRLNKSMYDESVFEKAGITHYTLYFQDGGLPPRHIMKRFLQISEEAKCAIAVHCKAGLGRTGSLIGSYLIKHYRMNAREAIGWMRICRPGSVIGHQQGWLEEMEPNLLRDGLIYTKRMQKGRDHSPEHRYGIYSIARKAKAFPTTVLRKPVEDNGPPFKKTIICNNNYQKVIRPNSPKYREALNMNAEKETMEWRSKKSNSNTRFRNEKNTITRGGGDLRTSRIETSKRENGPFSSATYTLNNKRSPNRSPTREFEREPSILIKNMQDAGRFLMSPYNEQKVNYLSSAVTVKPQQINNVLSQPHHKTVPIVQPQLYPQETPYSKKAAGLTVQQNRRRLGRSPSPPQVRLEPKKPSTPTNPISRDQSPQKSDLSFIREFNALKEKAQKIKRDSDTILKEALSRLKLQLPPRDSRHITSSFGAGSLGADRRVESKAAGPRPRDAPSTRSDERSIATQGDLLNSIKYQRRLRDNMLSDKSNLKVNEPKGIHDISDLPLIANKTDHYLNVPNSISKPANGQRITNLSKSPDRLPNTNSIQNSPNRSPNTKPSRSRYPSPIITKRTVHQF